MENAMTSSESFDEGKITFVHNDRVAFTTDGKLVNLLPAAYDYSGTLACVFADPPKAMAHMHQAMVTLIGIDPKEGEWGWGRGSRCVAWVSVPGREWEKETVICPLPSPDIDFLVVNARFQRTVAPSHDWVGKPVIPMIDQGVSIPFTGSVHLESGDPGLNRFASIIRSGNNLVLHQQETILNTAANFGSWDHASTGERFRTQWVAHGSPGIPVWADVGAPWRRNANQTVVNSGFTPSFLTTMANGCSIPSDPTNYGSTWAITLRVMFGVVSQAPA
jgi:hypothetical protein